jgi:DNA-binding transcriptional ArsR family regulator
VFGEDQTVIGEPDVVSIAALFADSARIEMLKALMDDRALPASELARSAGISRSTASAHLDRMLRLGVVTVRRQGRHAYYRMADYAAPDVMEALAALAVLAPARRPSSQRSLRQAQALGLARTCYDHLAGRIGVAVADSLQRRGLLRRVSDRLEVDVNRWDAAAPLGVSCAQVRGSRRPLARSCLDWSERRYHLGGALGVALTRRMFDLDWLRRSSSEPRVVTITPAGADGFRDVFGLDDL